MGYRVGAGSDCALRSFQETTALVCILSHHRIFAQGVGQRETECRTYSKAASGFPCDRATFAMQSIGLINGCQDCLYRGSRIHRQALHAGAHLCVEHSYTSRRTVCARRRMFCSEYARHSEIWVMQRLCPAFSALFATRISATVAPRALKRR